MLRYFPYTVLFLLVSCSGAELSDGGRYDKGQAENSNIEKIEAGAEDQDLPPPVAPFDSQLAPSTGGPGIDIPEAALTPIPVGGASLSCSYVENSPDEAKCMASSNDGKPLNFTAVNVYTIYGTSSDWHLVSFRVVPGATDSWIVSLPYGARNKSIGIIVGDASQSIIADWIIDESDKVTNLALDGGFEEHALDHSSPANLLPSQFLAPERQTAWKAVTTTSPQCKSVIEIQSKKTVVELGAIEGSQWIELDTSCSANYVTPGNNVSVYQDLTLEPGHLYEVSFFFKKRVGGITQESFNATFGSQTFATHIVTEEEWTPMSFAVTASETKMRLAFTETGDERDGRGTLIDDIKVLDLGDSKTVLENVKDRREGRRGLYTPPSTTPAAATP